MQLFLDLSQLRRHLDFAFLCRTLNTDSQDGDGLAEILEGIESVQCLLHDANGFLPILEAVSALVLTFHLTDGGLHLLVDDMILVQWVDIQHGQRMLRLYFLIGFLQECFQPIDNGHFLLIIRHSVPGRCRHHEL